MTDFLTEKIYVRFPNLRMDLESLTSFYHYNLMVLAKRGIQRTPSIYDEDSIWDYLISKYTLSELKALKSYRQKKYLLDNASVLEYASATSKNEDLAGVLKFLSQTIRLRDNMKAIEKQLSSTVDDSLPRTISPAAYINNGHINFRPKYDVTSPIIFSLVKQATNLKATFYINIYYNSLTKDFGSMIPVDQLKTWTFLEGFDRQTEAEFFPAILAGDIKATSILGARIQEKYFQNQNVLGKDYLFINTLEERRKILNILYDRFTESGVEILGLDDYRVYYQEKDVQPTEVNDYITIAGTRSQSKTKARYKHRVPVLAGYYVFDSDKKEFLNSSINQILGFSGEFSREPQYEDQLGYSLVNNENQMETFYQVEEDYSLYLEDIPQYTYNSFMTEVLTNLTYASLLSTDQNQILRWENNKFDLQLDKYWTESMEFDKKKELK